MDRPMLKTHKAGKYPGAYGGWSLGSKNRRGPGVPPPLVSVGGGPHLGPQQASWARVGGAKDLLSSLFLHPRGPLPPASPVLPSASSLCFQDQCIWGGEGSWRAGELSRHPGPEEAGQTPSSPPLLLPPGGPLLPVSLELPSASFLCPQDKCTQGKRVSWMTGDWPGSSAGSPVPERVGQLTSTPLPLLPGGPLPPTSPDLPGLREANPVCPPLLLPPLSPHVLPVNLGVPPISLSIRVTHQFPACALAVGRH